MARVSRIAERGWQQGSTIRDDGLLSQARRADGLKLEVSRSTLAIVVTQDCDLIHGSFDAEPVAEVLLTTEIPSTEWNDLYAAGRHPRRLHFRDADARCFSTTAKDRAFFDRKLLESHAPCDDRRLLPATVALIRSWLRKRYDRPAFPDEFDRRLKRERDQIRKVVEHHANEITLIYIALDTKEELKPDAPYHIRKITVIYDASKIEHDRGDKAASDVAAAVDRCDGVEVDDYAAVPITDFTLAAASESDAWDFDYLSYADEPEVEEAQPEVEKAQ